jgi:uncharacterized protein (TIRG00374 family)
MKNKKLISASIIVVLILFFIYYFKNNVNDFKAITLKNPLYIIPIFIISLLFPYVNGLIIKYFSEPFNIELKFIEWYGLASITAFYNMLTPFRGGMAVKAVYLKMKHNLSYTDYLSTVAGLYVINFFVASLLGLISAYIIYIKYNIYSEVVIITFALFFIFLLLLILFSPKFNFRTNELFNKFIRVINGWNLIRENNKVLISSIIITIVQFFLNAFYIIYSFRLFGIELSIEKGTFLSAILCVSKLVQITPSGLGINEAIAVFSGLILGITPAQSLAVSIISRIMDIVTLFVLGGIFTHILLNYEAANEKK